MSESVNLSENKRILLIDDQASIHDDFKKILQRQTQDETALDDLEQLLFDEEQSDDEFTLDFEITSVYQGEEALTVVEQSLVNLAPFAMAFVDVRMPPGMDGIETIEKLWQIDPQLQVVICTAFSDYSWDETIEKLGQTDRLLVLKKPFDTIEVMQLACALVAKWNLTRQARLNRQQLECLVQERTIALSEQKDALNKSLKRLQETRIQLFQADKLASIGQLAAGLAHEINNPIGYVLCNLNSLQGYLESLKPLLSLHKSLDTDGIVKQLPAVLDNIDLAFILEDIDDLMKDSLEGVERVGAIVRDLTEFSHVDTSDRVPVDVNELLEKTVSVAWNQLKHKIVIKRELQAVSEVVANGGQLGQVMLNLILNASQAIEDKGDIILSTGEDVNWIWFAVEDTGQGISKEQLNKIYDPFFTTKPVGEGTGLGLHIAHNIISNHQGRIECSSTIGQGTCFCIYLPKDIQDPMLKDETHNVVSSS